MSYRKFISLFACLFILHGCAAPVIVAGGAAAGAAASDRRTTDTIVEDQKIELEAEKAIYTNEHLKKQVRINVTSYNGVVLMTGEAPDPNLLNAAINLVRRVEGVRRIHNEVMIAPPAPQIVRNRDAWISTKIKTKLVATKGVNALNIEVTTSNKVVYLMGIVTKNEGHIAANVARGVEDVQQVIKLFEYQ